MRWFPITRGGRIRACLLLAVLVAEVVLVARPVAVWLAYTPQEGDVVFQSLPGGSDLVETIEGATHSPFSHCGAVVRQDGRWMVIEAIGNVHYTPLFLWIARGRGSHLAVYRLRPEHRANIPAMRAGMERLLGKPYDYRYELDDNSIYCSELVYKGWQAATGKPLGRLVKLGDLDWQPYRAVIGYYDGSSPDHLPLDRLMITPRDLALAPELERVFNFGF